MCFKLIKLFLSRWLKTEKARGTILDNKIDLLVKINRLDKPVGHKIFIHWINEWSNDAPYFKEKNKSFPRGFFRFLLLCRLSASARTWEVSGKWVKLNKQSHKTASYYLKMFLSCSIYLYTILPHAYYYSMQQNKWL